MSKKIKNIILGAGPTGLSVAKKLGKNTLVVEKEDQVGGLCRSIYKDGGVFDIGGHSFHTPHQNVYEYVNEVTGGLFYQNRKAFVHVDGYLIGYPFQKNYADIKNKKIVEECEAGLSNIKNGLENPDNFESYIVNKFGDGIANHFMLPYNRKLWARDLKELSIEWTSERIAGNKNEKESFENTGDKRKPLQSDTKVGYPKEGGFQEIFKQVSKDIQTIDLNYDAEKISINEKTIVSKDRRKYSWENLLSTMPIPELLKLINGVPGEINDCIRELKYMSLKVILILTKNVHTEVQRIYVSDANIPPHKIAFNHNSSDSLRERKNHAIMAEISYSDTKPFDQDSVNKTIRFLHSMDFINSREDVLWTDIIDVKYAYPIYTHNRLTPNNAVETYISNQHPNESVNLAAFSQPIT
ncbi:FAD-dependent oxidoreductase [candidate division KSB1 bacterium]|nr:FAD-dependent oxidoreductase [candidate division KSB1 bacterium]